MKLDLRQPLIVMSGAWNPAVLQPGWILRHLYAVPDNETHDLQLVLSSDTRKQAAYFRDVGISASTSRVEIFLNSLSPEAIQLGEAIGARILEKLPHTPFGALGINFQFTAEQVPPGLADRLATPDHLDEQFSIAMSEAISRIRLSTDLQLNFTRRLSDSGAVLDFNFHHLVPTTAAAMPLLRDAIARYRRQSHEIMRTFYDMREAGLINHEFP